MATSLSVDAVIPLAPAALLAQAGFRRSRRTFTRTRGELTDSVFFQTARGAPFSFSIHLAVFHSFHHEVCRGTPLPKAPSVDNATWLVTTQVSFTGKKGATPWVVMEHGHPAAEYADRIAAPLGASLSFFERWETLDAIIAALESGDPAFEWTAPLDLAILLAFRGEQARARELLRSLGRDQIPAGVAERLGL